MLDSKSSKCYEVLHGKAGDSLDVQGNSNDHVNRQAAGHGNNLDPNNGSAGSTVGGADTSAIRTAAPAGQLGGLSAWYRLGSGQRAAEKFPATQNFWNGAGAGAARCLREKGTRQAVM